MVQLQASVVGGDDLVGGCPQPGYGWGVGVDRGGQRRRVGRAVQDPGVHAQRGQGAGGVLAVAGGAAAFARVGLHDNQDVSAQRVAGLGQLAQELRVVDGGLLQRRMR